MTDERLREIEERICTFQRPHDWDGEEAPEISATACDAAVRLVRAAWTVAPNPRVSPSTVRGAVALTWRVGEDSFTVFVHENRFDFQWVKTDRTATTGTMVFAALLAQLAFLHKAKV